MNPERIEEYRDRLWHREEQLRISNAEEVENLVEDLGFCLALTDARTPMPSVYIAVCGRRDVHSPRNPQKDPEMSLSWRLKDDVMRRGNVYYSKLVKGRAMFVAPRLIPSFRSLYGIPRKDEPKMLTKDAKRVLRVLRKEWESSTSDLREDARIPERKNLTKAIVDLQRAMKVIPFEVLYEPKFTYLWTLGEERFPVEFKKRQRRETAIYNLAFEFLRMQGLTKKGDLAKAIGVSRKEAGMANHKLVDRGIAHRIENGVYQFAELL